MKPIVPRLFFIPSLLLFNLGIEIGQLSLLGFLVPLLWQIDKTRYRDSILKIGSLLIGLLALFWFFQRLFMFY